VSRSPGPYTPLEGTGSVEGAVLGSVTGGGASLTFFEHAAAAAHSSAVINTRVVVLVMAFIPTSSSGEVNTATDLHRMR
jgi:hypothetical protein